MDFALDDEQALIVATIRRFVDRELAARAADADRAGAPPENLLELAGEVGFLVDAVPESADGAMDDHYSHITRALRGIELGRGCAALAAVLESNVEPALAVGRWGSDAAKQRLFESLIGGGLATTTSDVHSRLTIASDGDGLVISGSLGPVPVLAAADHLLLCARTGDEPVLALIPTADATVDSLTPSAWRAARWGAFTADQLKVPAELVLARGIAGLAAITKVMAWYRVSLAARAVGVSLAAMKHAAGYASERIQFDQPIGRFESLIRMRDANETAALAARTFVLEAAWHLDADVDDAADAASRARAFAADVVSRATIDAVQIYGGYGFVNDYPVEKLMRDARAFDVICGNEALERVLAIKETL